jgi:hypothetical protein
MGFGPYLKTIKEKTGKTPEDFKVLADKKGLTTYQEVMAWLKVEYGLGHGHANLIAQLLTKADKLNVSKDEALDKHFSGDKSKWRKPYDELAARLQKFGADVSFGPNRTYINLLKGGKKFGIIQLTADRLDIGIKLKGTAPTARFTDAAKWNAMVTHRVSIKDPQQIDAEVLAWLKKAYEAA